MRYPFITVVCIVPLLLGCQSTLKDEARVLLETDERFATASVEHGMSEAFFRFMAPDGIQLRPGGDPVVGPEAIRNRLSTSSDFRLSWVPHDAEVSSSRDLGYTWGTYTLEQIARDDTIRIGSGKYLNVWRKQPDGTWKVLVDIGNEDPSTDATNP